MREVGIVKHVKGKFAEIRAAAGGECIGCAGEKSCGSSSLWKNNKDIIIVKNDIYAKEGDLVAFELSESDVLAGAFIIYMIPFLFFAVGVILGITLEKGFGFRLGNLENALSVATSAIFLWIGMLVVRKKDREQKGHSYITEILLKKEDASHPNNLC
ncbi:MAG: SoxR reducing system RseC family protein [Caldisericota bacterium]|nr:SoxR reducing system RseC family protein [Caldisericota bacterium]